MSVIYHSYEENMDIIKENRNREGNPKKKKNRRRAIFLWVNMVW
jgi:hypothetical protein